LHHAYAPTLLFFSPFLPHRDLPSFPTRRSSDLSTPTPTILVEFLTTRVNQASLPFFVRGLTDRNPRVVAGIVTILSHSRGYNPQDRKSTRLNSSHQIISYAVFCL